MKWTATRNSERGAQGNHTDWEIVQRDADGRVWIRCLCHKHSDLNSDFRIINEEQLIKE